MFPHEAQLLQEETRSYINRTISHFQHQFTSIIDSLLQSLQQHISLPNVDIIKFQLDSLKKLPPVISNSSIAYLPEDQYKAITTLSNVMGSHNNQWPYFFLTGAAGTGKSFIIHHFRMHLQRMRKKYLVLAPTGVAAQNIDGATIHSALKISSTATNYSSYQTLIFDSENLQTAFSIDTTVLNEYERLQQKAISLPFFLSPQNQPS